MKMLSRRKALINEPMRQFLIDRAQTLYYEARQFPKTRRVAENWIRLALRFAKQVGDMELYRQTLIVAPLCDAKTEKLT